MKLRDRLLLAALLLFCAAPLRAQEPAPAELTGAMLDADGTIGLTRAWSYQPGDDPRWSDPAFDDSGWATVEPQMPVTSRPRGGWNGTGWFRRHIRIDEAMARQSIVLRLESPGAADVYLDGRLAVRSVAPQPGSGQRRRERSGAWATVRFSGPGLHVFAVRYSCSCGNPPERIGFSFSLEQEGALDRGALGLRRRATIYGIFLAIPAILAGLHFGLFVFYPRARENLFCALCLLSFATIVGASFGDDLGAPDLVLRVLESVNILGVVSAIFFGLLTYFAMGDGPIPRSWRFFAILGALLFVLSIFVGATADSWMWVLYFAASLVEIVRTEMRGRTVRRESAFPLLIGMLLLDAAIVWQIMIIFGAVLPPFGFPDVYIFGVLAFSIATSLFVARSFARTSVHLERRLAEVQALSGQVIAAERESARKGMEIEAARTLQRSILPSSIPVAEGLEIAARVTTATEVGGDYYDFRHDGDAVIVAVGDAAGHGVAAGAMVTATKALFSSLAGEHDLPSVLGRCDRVLRGMNVRPLHMCLLLARITQRSVSVCSAAMPCALRLVAASGAVEEIAAGGPPLAVGPRSAWNEVDSPLAPGDVLLFASDGLAEALSAEGEPMGYERVASLFASHARGRSAAELVDALLEEAVAWRGSHEQSDDIAVVVVRVTG